MSSGKSRKSKLREQYGEGFPQWYYWLTAHALTHSGIVLFITNSYLFAILELVSHWVIDFCKCEKWITVDQDQFTHFIIKLIYCAIFYYSQT